MPHQHFQGLGAFEWAVVGAAILASAWCVWLAVRYTLHPGETEPDHVKRSILDAPRRAAAGPSPAPARSPSLPSGGRPAGPGEGATLGAR